MGTAGSKRPLQAASVTREPNTAYLVKAGGWLLSNNASPVVIIVCIMSETSEPIRLARQALDRNAQEAAHDAP